MGVWRGGPKEPPPTRGEQLRAWLFLLGVIAVVSVTLGGGMAATEERFCAGTFDTPQCHKDRAEAKARAYERYKERG